MSVWHSAALIYGVILNENEKVILDQHEERDEIFDSFALDCNLMSSDGDIVIGITVDSIECGEATELGSILEPRSNEVDELLDTLDKLGINREPTWVLASTIS